ncbi:hypothetical protein ACFSFZ_13940 [Mixta tenebrionis]|uniref:Uncharacterized protein n=1 Tax=Mixta tenebrionis TaxID=2562439 RepID=A0A506VCC0_9GAMM|nr:MULTISPECIES: hypothetical protein [Mixta]QHM75215.1 hypothetical protein C7M52_01165 [Mixta theicola]TPW43116.1 hypothetical protein FKM52_05975 [Mixta tenebrionis]
MKSRVAGAAIAVIVLALMGCKEEEGIHFIKNPDNPGEVLTPPAWASMAREELQGALSMSVFSARCKLLYRDSRWFVGCKPANAKAPVMLYALKKNEALRESFIAMAVNNQARQYTRQNVLLRQIVVSAEPHEPALIIEKLQQDFTALNDA